MSSYYQLTDEQLLALPTDRLYKIFKIYRSGCLSLYALDDIDDDEYTTEQQRRHDLIKAELDNRGHIPRKHNPNGDNVDMATSSPSRYVIPSCEPKREPPHGSIENYEDAIGKQVYKKSKKPFKSKNMYNTVKAVTENPHTKLPAFSFEEDESIVDANICNIRKVKS